MCVRRSRTELDYEEICKPSSHIRERYSRKLSFIVVINDNFSSRLILCNTFFFEGLPHQSRSYPGGGGSGNRTLARNSSISSQSSLEGAPCSSNHRGSSPQIRAFDPDGRHHARHDPLHAASSYPPNRSSRSV